MPNTYVPDTHALLWFLAKSPRLSTTARSIFRAERKNEAALFVPTIVVAELIWIVRAGRIQTDLSHLLATIQSHYNVTTFTAADALQLPTLPNTLSIHDAMIVWEAKKRGATVITRDNAIQASDVVPTIW